MSEKNHYRCERSKPNQEGQLKIPRGWMNCPRQSFRIISNTFVVLKTPLDFKYNSQIPTFNRFNPRMFFSSMSMKRVRIGLWIDLTNTNRYYNKCEIFDMGCTYVKIPCAGHLEPPNQRQTQSFVNLCLRFTQDNPFQLIAVHCTHGFNRTGFMIVSYLIEEFGYDVDSAIAEFAAARPPGIYKQNKIDELYRRYSNIEPIQAPELPNWSFR